MAEETIECVLTSIGTGGASNLGIVHTLLHLGLTGESIGVYKRSSIVVIQDSLRLYTYARELTPSSTIISG